MIVTTLAAWQQDAVKSLFAAEGEVSKAIREAALMSMRLVSVLSSTSQQDCTESVLPEKDRATVLHRLL